MVTPCSESYSIKCNLYQVPVWIGLIRTNTLRASDSLAYISSKLLTVGTNIHTMDTYTK